ncbi:MAG: hypothetical protein VKJ02_12560 [Snowella sp.]|nr:hypothetical protein [Snowella sp.]
MPIELVRIKKPSSVPTDSNPESPPSDAITKQPIEEPLKKITQSKKKSKKTEITVPAEINESVFVEASVEKETSLKPVEPSSDSQPTSSKKKKKKKKKATADSSKSNDLATNLIPTNPLEPGAFFQAIGVVSGKLVQQESRYCLQIEEQVYPISISGKKFNQVVKLEQEVYFRVYPHWFISFENQEEQSRLAFRIMGASTQPFGLFEVNHFILRGIWQKSPVTGEPLLTVYRNQSRGRWDKCKPLHIPLIWEDAPVEPFYYDPNLTKDEQVKRYFCQLEAIFDAESQTFKVIRQLDEPTTQIPPYVKRQKFSQNVQREEQ